MKIFETKKRGQGMTDYAGVIAMITFVLVGLAMNAPNIGTAYNLLLAGIDLTDGGGGGGGGESGSPEVSGSGSSSDPGSGLYTSYSSSVAPSGSVTPSVSSSSSVAPSGSSTPSVSTSSSIAPSGSSTPSASTSSSVAPSGSSTPSASTSSSVAPSGSTPFYGVMLPSTHVVAFNSADEQEAFYRFVMAASMAPKDTIG